MNDFVSRGFRRRRSTPAELADRVPPGQYVERGFPVLTAGPTPRIDNDAWGFRVDGMVGGAVSTIKVGVAAGKVTVGKRVGCGRGVKVGNGRGVSVGGNSMVKLLPMDSPVPAFTICAYQFPGWK